jgi:predicted DNA-binding protein
LKSFWGRGNTTPEIDIEQLKGMLGVAGKYALYTNFKARVLEDARRRLLDNMHLAFSYEEKKEAGRGGGRVVAVRFRLFRNTPKRIKEGISEFANGQEMLFLPTSEENMQNTEGVTKDTKTDDLTTKIASFGVKPKQLKQLKETFNEAEIRQAVAVTEGVIANGKLKTSAAGFFVSALKNHYEANIDVKTVKNEGIKAAKKPKTTAETAPKLSPEEQAKADKVAQRAIETRLQFEREKAIIEKLIEEDIELVNEAVAEIRRGMFGFAYNEAKNFAENRENKVFEAAFLNTIKKMRGELFV